MHEPRLLVSARTLVRTTGTALIVLGVVALAWGFATWKWGDPLTGAYTSWQQRKLSREYNSLVSTYRPARRTTTSSRRRVVRPLDVAARRFRKHAHGGQAIGRIHVDRLDLVEGTDGDSLRKGPGRDRRTYMPGEGQLVYIAGHRTTFGAPFAHIDSLRRGDRVVLQMPYGRFVYGVTGSVIVPADDLARLRTHGREVIALQACHPRFSARERYIVYAAPVRPSPARAATHAAVNNTG
jgi:sortase A